MKTIIYKVKVEYKGTDGYGYGLTRHATRVFKFDSHDEAEAFNPTPIEVVEGHGVYSTLFPTWVTITKEESSKTEIGKRNLSE